MADENLNLEAGFNCVFHASGSQPEFIIHQILLNDVSQIPAETN